MASNTVPRQIIVTGASSDATNTNLTVQIVCWLVAPATMVVPLPGAVSKVPLASVGGTLAGWGITGAELAALQNGTVVEQVSSVSLPVAGLTNAALEALGQARYTALQTALNNAASALVTHFVGAWWDATDGWNAGP